jgi:hypothetical protein
LLARHAVELALKDLLLVYEDNVKAEHVLDVAKGQKPRSSHPHHLDWTTNLKTHDLNRLLIWVEREMPRYVGRKWRPLVRQITRFEGKNPEWSRYREVTTRIQMKKGKDRYRKRRTFFRQRLVTVQTLVEKVETFIKEAAVVDIHAQENESALQELLMISDDIDRQLYAYGFP